MKPISASSKIKTGRQLETLFGAMVEGVLVHDLTGKVIQYNSAALRILDLTEDQMLKMTTSDSLWTVFLPDGSVLPKDKHPAVVTLTTRKSHFFERLGVKNSSHHIRWLKVNAVPIFLEQNDRPDQVMVTLHDISEQVEAQNKNEDERRNLESKLNYSARMASIGQLAAGLAHEINNPLAIIGGRIHQLKDLCKKDVLEKTRILYFAESLESSVERIARVIRSLRSFARDSDDKTMSKASFDKILNDSLEFCVQRFRNHNVELILPQEKVETIISCRPQQISQVVLSLLNNAFDALEGFEKMFIEIKVQDLNEMIELRIRNSGDKVLPALRDKIFEPFFTTKEIGKGAGLGLSVAKGIIESHRGKIFLDPSDELTCFVIQLPKN